MINEQLISKIAKERQKQNIPLKKYSFLFNSVLGNNGEFPNHKLIGKEIENKNTKEVFLIEKVCLRYVVNGYVWTVIASDEDNFLFPFYILNVNSTDEKIFDYISEFNLNFTVK